MIVITPGATPAPKDQQRRPAGTAGRCPMRSRRVPTALVWRASVPLAFISVAFGLGGPAHAATSPPPAHVVAPRASAAPQTPAPDVPASPCQVTLTGISPSVPRLKSTLTVSGIATVAATPSAAAPSGAPAPGAREVSVRLRIGLSPLGDRAALRTHVSGAAIAATAPVSSASGAAVEERLAGPPDSPQRFSLSVPVRDLGLGGSGVYPIAVECVDASTGEQLGQRPSVLPWVPYTEGITPTPIVVLYPFSTAPAMGPDGALVSPAPARQISPDGRLGRLLSTAEKHRATITWAEDAATSDILAALAADGSDADAEVRANARSALTSVVGMERTALGVSPAQYAMGDVGAIARSRSDALIAESIALAETSVRARQTGENWESDDEAASAPAVLAWPAGLRANARTVGALARSGASGVVLAEAAMPALPGGAAPAAGAVALPTSDGVLPALIQDVALSAAFDGTPEAIGPTPSGTPDGAQAGQRPATGTELSQVFVADSLQIALAQPDQPVPVVVAPAARWSPDVRAVDRSLTAIEQARWLRPIAASAALRGELPAADAAGRAPLTHTVALGEQELPADWVAQAQRNNESLQLLRQIVATESAQGRSVEAANLRSVSSAWRNRPDLGRQVLGLTTQSADALQNDVRIVSAGTITLARDQARIPVTIANDLAEPVRVTLRLQAQPASRLVTGEGVGVLTVEAGRKLSVEVPATVVGGGELPVDVQLQTPEGADFGTPVTLTLRTTAYAQAAGQIVALAFVALVIGLGVNFVRRRRQSRRQDAEPAVDADSASTDADLAAGQVPLDQADPEVRR